MTPTLLRRPGDHVKRKAPMRAGQPGPASLRKSAPEDQNAKTQASAQGTVYPAAGEPVSRAHG